MNNRSTSLSRRKFIGNASLLSIMGAFKAGGLFTSCDSRKGYIMPDIPVIAPDGPPLKAGLIGCGDRGTGAALNFVDAGPNLQITALADVLPDRIANCRKHLKEHRGIDIPDENCHLGFDAYKRVIDSDVDVILETSLAYCRPAHFEAAIQARKHVFLEKPAGVDAVGIRRVMAAGKMADAAGLTVIAGTQRRHGVDYNQTFAMVKNGAIGELISGTTYRLGMGPGIYPRQEGWCDMEFMIRSKRWIWITGDIFLNFNVHVIDILNWFFEKHPVKAIGLGGKLRRPQGNNYDIGSVEYIFDNGKNYHCLARYIDGCDLERGVKLLGTKGYTNCENKIWDYDGNLIWEYDYPLDERGRPRLAVPQFNQSHINLVTAIRTNKPVNETHNLATSSMTGLLGREAAYTGKNLEWDNIMNSNLSLVPEKLQMGNVTRMPETPVPGTAPVSG